ncbi:MAG: response regulator [Byssovorax sp.]
MQKSILVVVDTDASLQRTVVRLAEGAGLEVVVCATPRAAWNACGALAPDCLVIGVSPSDHEAFWLLAALRARLDDAATLPLIALAAREPGAHAASTTRIQALEAGADVVLQKPIETSELLAQVKALTKMATRIRARRDVLFDADGPDGGAGDLDLEPVSEVLRALEERRWSGALHLTDRGFASGALAIDVRDGALLAGRLDDRELTPIEALREALSWSGRRFELFPADASTEAIDTTEAASLAELLRMVLWTPGARALGARSDEDLPEVSARTPSPTPTLEAALAAPKVPAIDDAAQAGASGPRGERGPRSERISHAPGRSLVESVRQSVRPDPRAESDE